MSYTSRFQAPTSAISDCPYRTYRKLVGVSRRGVLRSRCGGGLVGGGGGPAGMLVGVLLLSCCCRHPTEQLASSYDPPRPRAAAPSVKIVEELCIRRSLLSCSFRRRPASSRLFRVVRACMKAGPSARLRPLSPITVVLLLVPPSAPLLLLKSVPRSPAWLEDAGIISPHSARCGLLCAFSTC